MENKVKYRYPTPDEFVPGFKYQLQVEVEENQYTTFITWEDRVWDMREPTPLIGRLFLQKKIRVWI